MLERSLLDWLTGNVGGRWIIAGGYVRDRIIGRTPRDVDCFALGAKGMSDQVKLRLDKLHIPFTIEPKAYGFPHHSAVELHSRFDPAIQFHLLGQEVHLVCTPKERAIDVVETFDFNICRFYLDDDLQACPFQESDMSDLFAKNMLLCHTRTPMSSLRRGFLFEFRLGMKFQPADARRLVEELAKRGTYDI